MFEEYWYDALGRRVLKRARGDALCETGHLDDGICLDYLERYVWDGDQMLFEARSLVDDESASAGELNVTSPSYASQAGRVTYTHAGGIDQPLDLIRHSEGAIVPHANARGAFDVPTDSTGGTFSCAPEETGGRLRLEWPGAVLWSYQNKLGELPDRWYGSVVQGHRDMSGLTYLRNRYYDPNTGQFTQTDPIGIAGGLNVYGFVGGDPVNFSDPFGLCVPWCTALLGGGVFGGIRIVANLVTDRPWHEGVAQDIALGAAVGATLGLAAPALIETGVATTAGGAAATEGVALGAAAVGGIIPFTGFQQWGRETVQSGGRASGAIARTAEITAEQAAKLDPTKVRQALEFYRNAVNVGEGGRAALERVRLMERILELQ